MRLIQRHGRIDRIGSPHRTVFLRTFFPDRQLDALLNLEERVRRKLAQAAASVGVEDAPIELGATGEQTFAETRGEIERLRRMTLRSSRQAARRGRLKPVRSTARNSAVRLYAMGAVSRTCRGA